MEFREILKRRRMVRAYEPEPVPRETLVQVTGPWVFDREALVEALARVAGNEARITDMIGLCDVAQMRVRALPAQ